MAEENNMIPCPGPDTYASHFRNNGWLRQIFGPTETTGSRAWVFEVLTVFRGNIRGVLNPKSSYEVDCAGPRACGVEFFKAFLRQYRQQFVFFSPDCIICIV